MNYKKKQGIGLKYALNGIRIGCKQRNLIIHFLVAALVVIAGFILKLNAIEWSIILFCIGGVVSIELLNSAIELIVDQVSPEYSRFAKHAKDIAAAAVLVFSIVSVIIGLIILLPKFIELYV